MRRFSYTPYRQPIPDAVMVHPDGTEEVLWGHTYQCYTHGAGHGQRCLACKQERETRFKNVEEYR